MASQRAADALRRTICAAHPQAPRQFAGPPHLCLKKLMYGWTSQMHLSRMSALSARDFGRATWVDPFGDAIGGCLFARTRIVADIARDRGKGEV